MSSCADLQRGVVTMVALLCCVPALAGCFESHLCSVEERCNDFDDDCDGTVDEGFLDAAGRYVTDDHCGRCGVACEAVFPTAAATRCDVPADAVPQCHIVDCPAGTRLIGDAACVPEVAVLCLPCSVDKDCQLGTEGGLCVEVGVGAAVQRRCGLACDGGCPEGTVCKSVDGGTRDACLPAGGDCSCNAGNAGLELGCLLERDPDFRCAGIQVCGPDTVDGFAFGPCMAALEEACNGQDDDCDGGVDESFVDAAGRYLGPLHCGACGVPCVEPGPNTQASCLPDGTGARCEVGCLDGFVDVDGIAANGCECERFDGEGPPPSLGTDRDCDGVIDDDDDFVYVSTTGSDSDPGTLVRPVRTIQRGAEIGEREGKDVLVSRGVYDGGFDLVAGVDVFGGYRPDFRDRDLELFPVLLENRAEGPGAPVLRCRGVNRPTTVEGFQISGSDASADGQGATAVWLDRCSEAVVLRDLTVLAGRAAAGRRGDSSSDRLMALGIDSLAELDGRAGGSGVGTVSDCRSGAGAGGKKTCVATGSTVDVAGGDGGAGACPDLGCNQTDPCGNAGCTDFTVGGACDLESALAVAVANPAAARGAGADPGVPGESTYNAPTNRDTCNFCDDNPTIPRLGAAGGAGGSGVDGTPGLGCGAAPRLVAGRLIAASGSPGTAGTDGSGGGGGSAGAGYSVIEDTIGVCNDVAGGSGGGGGSGGCGAPAADGGQGGGASVGVLLELGTGLVVGPSLDDVRIVTASGGAGGDGGFGAAGGSGGLGGLGGTSAFFCARAGGAGGNGGPGGAGGAGGGGCGGGTHGIVISGAPSSAYQASIMMGTTIEQAGVPGGGGRGGFSPAGSGGVGADGANNALLIL